MNDSGTAAGNWQDRPGYLYRYWSNADALLYVGISVNAVARPGQHRGKLWFPKIAKITIERFSTYAEAEAAELRAICREGPMHNVKGPRSEKDLRCALSALRAKNRRDAALKSEELRRAFNIDRIFGCIPLDMTIDEYASKRVVS